MGYITTQSSSSSSSSFFSFLSIRFTLSVMMTVVEVSSDSTDIRRLSYSLVLCSVTGFSPSPQPTRKITIAQVSSTPNKTVRSIPTMPCHSILSPQPIAQSFSAGFFLFSVCRLAAGGFARSGWGCFLLCFIVLMNELHQLFSQLIIFSCTFTDSKPFSGKGNFIL